MPKLALSPRRVIAGAVVALVGIVVVVAVLVPFRTQLNVDTAALVMIIPVVLGVIVGGSAAAPVGVVVGFLAFDFFFIPPYGTLTVGGWEHWVSLGVYATVSFVVGGVVGRLQQARQEAQRRQQETQVLFELSHAVASETSLDASLARVLTQVREVLGVPSAAVFLLDESQTLSIASSDGEPLPAHAVQSVVSRWRAATSVTQTMAGLSIVPITASADAVGALAVAGDVAGEEAHRMLRTMANQAALLVERSRLAEEATRTRMLEEVDRLRSALMGSVSHDLRTPLASIKAAVSDLGDRTLDFDEEDRATLIRTIEEQTDRLTRLVTNLLDMSRIQAGALELRRTATPLLELIDTAMAGVADLVAAHRTVVDVAPDLPLVDVDFLLVEQVLVNLLENAARYSPAGTTIAITADHLLAAWTEVRVSDEGPGIPSAE
ncbi:MAG: DUF4118 domain-containing protein, partial [Acidimicrobiia bacterium]|nr:DUF4118 domain-containing protein [Acidimicrobiia bacterium]